ncbi:MAG: response regulator [Nitrospinae bacterium]|nr:response regulator [Nitrospinota bacterium]
MRSNSIQARLTILLFLMLIVPALAVGWITYSFSIETIKSERMRVVGQVATGKRELLASTLSQSNGRALAFLSAMVAGCRRGADGIDARCAGRAVGSFVKNEDARGALLRLRGNARDIVIGTLSLSGGQLPEFAPGQLAVFSRMASEEGQPFFIQATDPSSGALFLLEYPLAGIQAIFSSPQELGDSGETFLADRNGFFITHARFHSMQGRTTEITARPMKRCLSRENTEVLDLDYRDVPIIHGFRYIPEIGGGCIMAHIDQAEAFASLDVLKRKLLLATAMFLGIAFIVAMYFARSIARPIGNLTEATRVIASGDYSVRAAVEGNDEIGQLASSFNLMAEKLYAATEFLEQQVRERTMQLEATNEELNSEIVERGVLEQSLRQARQQADEANRAKSEFLATMSHEIRTPLNAIIGMADLLAATRMDRAQNDYVRVIQNAGDSLLEIISDILDLSKIEAGQMDLETIPFDMVDLLEKTSEIYSIRARGKGIALTVCLEPAMARTVAGDPTRLRQVIVNLLGNAIKFTHAGEIVLSARELSRGGDSVEVQVSVKDTGIGIPSGKLDTIFENFSQVDSSTTRKFGGTGLGLSIVRRLVMMMAGRIWVESEVGKGSAFHFTVRFKLPGAHELPLPASDDGGEARTAQIPIARRPLHILLAEDSEMNQQVVTHILRAGGHTVSLAANGWQAVDAARNHTFDLVIMDIHMPELDGEQAAKMIRHTELSTGARVPIIAFTAMASKEDRDRYLATGMDGYISKPVKAATLLAYLDRFGGNAPSPAPTAETQETANSTGNAKTPGTVDWGKALARCNNSGELLRHIAAMFIAAREKMRVRAREALAQKEFGALAEIAHKLKGEGGLLGADWLTQSALALEKAARAGQGDLLEQCLADLEANTANLVSQLRVMLDAPRNPG